MKSYKSKQIYIKWMLWIEEEITNNTFLQGFIFK